MTLDWESLKILSHAFRGKQPRQEKSFAPTEKMRGSRSAPQGRHNPKNRG
jgi:hypothetical protein